MKAGRELDALVAEKVMGWTPIINAPSWSEDYRDPQGYPVRSRPFSTDIAAAWEVVEKIVSGDLEAFALTIQPGTIGASFSNLAGKRHFQSNGETAPHAICLAALDALKAVGG